MRLKHLTPEQATAVANRYLAELEAVRLQAELKRAADEAHDEVGGGVEGVMRAIEAVEAHMERVASGSPTPPATPPEGGG